MLIILRVYFTFFFLDIFFSLCMFLSKVDLARPVYRCANKHKPHNAALRLLFFKKFFLLYKTFQLGEKCGSFGGNLEKSPRINEEKWDASVARRSRVRRLIRYSATTQRVLSKPSNFIAICQGSFITRPRHPYRENASVCLFIAQECSIPGLAAVSECVPQITVEPVITPPPPISPLRENKTKKSKQRRKKKRDTRTHKRACNRRAIKVYWTTHAIQFIAADLPRSRLY